MEHVQAPSNHVTASLPGFRFWSSSTPPEAKGIRYQTATAGADGSHVVGVLGHSADRREALLCRHSGTRVAPSEPSLTRLLVTTASWQEADYYASLMHTGKQQIERTATHDGEGVDLELVLGSDALVHKTQVDVANTQHLGLP